MSDPLSRDTPSPSPRRHRNLADVLRRVGIVLLASLVIGAATGYMWWLVTPLPAYEVRSDGLAVMGERELAQIFAADAWFTAIGIVAGAAIGLLAALQLGRRIGWLVVWVVLVDATVAALVCWLVGGLLGPSGFEARLAAAQPGDLVPVSLTVRAWVSVAVWPFIGLLPVLFWATLARDPEEPRPIRTPWRAWRERRAGRGVDAG